jgi:prefoldin subunit 5
VLKLSRYLLLYFVALREILNAVSQVHMSQDADINSRDVCIKHELFICTELKPRLSELLKVRGDIVEEINEYEKFNDMIKKISQSKSKNIKTDCDVGLGFKVEAVIEDPTCIYVHVGMGFHVEMDALSIPEFVSQRQTLLRSRLDIIQEDCDKVADHIKDVSIF